MTDETPRHIPSSVPEPATASWDRAEEDSAPQAVHLPEESTVIPSLPPSVPLMDNPLFVPSNKGEGIGYYQLSKEGSY